MSTKNTRKFWVALSETEIGGANPGRRLTLAAARTDAEALAVHDGRTYYVCEAVEMTEPCTKTTPLTKATKSKGK